jgi:hypothetical protein
MRKLIVAFRNFTKALKNGRPKPLCKSHPPPHYLHFIVTGLMHGTQSATNPTKLASNYQYCDLLWRLNKKYTIWMELKPILTLADVASAVQQGQLTLIMKTTEPTATIIKTANKSPSPVGSRALLRTKWMPVHKNQYLAVVVAVNFGLIPALSDLHSRRYFLKFKAASINN